MKLWKIAGFVALVIGANGFAKEKKAPTKKGKSTKQEQKVDAKKKSLFDRLGGKGAIEAVVGEFLGNVTSDQRISGYFKTTDAAGLKAKLVDQICQATGGPCKYSGMDMKSAHAAANLKRASSGAHDKVGDAEFTALVEDLVKALDKFKVPAQEKNELISALGGMKNDIVSPK